MVIIQNRKCKNGKWTGKLAILKMELGIEFAKVKLYNIGKSDIWNIS